MQRGYFKNEYGGNLRINREDIRMNRGGTLGMNKRKMYCKNLKGGI